MRTLALTLSTVVFLAVTGCGSDMSSDPTPEPGNADTTQVDAEKFAVRLEQVFAGSSYPSEQAGAEAAAQKDGLKLSPGNSIGSYVYDPDDVEFKLCVENTDGAYATYNTSPMSVQDSGDSGGCP